MINKKQLLLLLFLSASAMAQEYILDSVKGSYPFVNWDANKIKYAEESPAFLKLYQKLNKIAKGKEEDVHVFHIGGSHIQADIYSNKLRSYLQHMSPTAKGQRGLIFPYRMAKTNNPLNYKVTHTGNWKGHRCSVVTDSVAWGLTGVTAVFRDSVSHIKVQANYKNYKDHVYSFNKIRVFYNDWESDYNIKLNDSIRVNHTVHNPQKHFVEFALDETVENLDFDIQKVTNAKNGEFLMMGLELMNDHHGIEYTTIGVNGASFEYYNRCYYFKEHLLLYQPDLFIVSVGTNDTYRLNFDAEQFKANYEKMILDVLQANPDAAILLTVPNDSYYKKKYANPHTQKAREIMYQLADKYQMAVWDLYEIMGGLGSSQKWYANKLMPSDRIHFTRKGYSIKADLLLEALTASWEKTLALEPKSILKQITNE